MSRNCNFITEEERKRANSYVDSNVDYQIENSNQTPSINDKSYSLNQMLKYRGIQSDNLKAGKSLS